MTDENKNTWTTPDGTVLLIDDMSATELRVALYGLIEQQQIERECFAEALTVSSALYKELTDFVIEHTPDIHDKTVPTVQPVTLYDIEIAFDKASSDWDGSKK